MIWIYSLYMVLIISPTILVLFNIRSYRELDKRYFERFSRKQNLHWLGNYRKRPPILMKWGIYGILLKQKKYNPEHLIFSNISEEEYNFIKDSPVEIKNKIMIEMAIRRCILFAIGFVAVAIFIFCGGLDYLLEPITYHTL